MKKRILSVALAVLMVACLVGCGTTYQEATGQAESNTIGSFCNGHFTKIIEWEDAYSNYYIVYANDTKVKYLVMSAQTRSGITPLYNADGTLQIYEESED